MAIFVPGDIVPESGVYSVKHDGTHRQPHDVTCIVGRKFPPCRGCGHPKFALKLGAVHISSHPSFKA